MVLQLVCAMYLESGVSETSSQSCTWLVHVASGQGVRVSAPFFSEEVQKGRVVSSYTAQALETDAEISYGDFSGGKYYTGRSVRVKVRPPWGEGYGGKELRSIAAPPVDPLDDHVSVTDECRQALSSTRVSVASLRLHPSSVFVEVFPHLAVCTR